MDKLERVARAICTARGGDPDDVGGALVEVTGFGSTQRNASATEPGWKYYVDDARAFIAAHEALTGG